ncbi:hypothetical protein CU044_1799 [Streptomyces sp. L-9-10]|nr:hypothetical protein CU044_1799 [Streptomyces sp. L-9-10]
MQNEPRSTVVVSCGAGTEREEVPAAGDRDEGGDEGGDEAAVGGSEVSCSHTSPRYRGVGVP